MSGSSSNNIEVIVDDTVSIDDLARLQAEGFSVLRSAHIGNLSPYNLALADAGIPILSVDHTITGVDTNYFPEQIQTQAERQTIAPLGRLVCRTRSQDGRYLDDLHIAAVNTATPGANVYTNTAYLQAYQDVAGEIVGIAARNVPEVFNRLALPDGTTSKQANAGSMIGRFGVMQLSDEPRAERTAVIMPNLLDIVANFVIEAIKSERATQYHLSGPDMCRYIGKLLPGLQDMYWLIRAVSSFGDALPERLDVRLVPTAPAKFATTMARRPQLDRILASYQEVEAEMTALNGVRRNFFMSPLATDLPTKTAFVSAMRGRQSSLEQEMAERIADIPELFSEPGRPGFITQYDVIAEGGLYVPDVNRQLSMAELSVMSQGLKKITKGLRL